ncbi:hypothetical protein [Prochlorothrix hollandica]|uniref:Uncharacterized protein n=1 Tax=Prochlorothrix hollandica PCC 9006 = CALU 1027 TaxID=317619 RepID=A0A0M2PYY8_PROHO|nr:hypothetical protein [Prochlorothrix hollandica]KKI99898.1 hypothetical protein PROH_08815 [Prochlorothrix hollandica PCC 9006 = CALU 1027]
MSELTPIEIQRRVDLLTTQIMGQHLDTILEQITKLAKDFKIAQDTKEKSPFRNVLTVATEPGSSLEVIKNYIRYQVGRKGSSAIWKDGKGAFSKELVARLDNLKINAKTIFQDLQSTLVKTNQDAQQTIQEYLKLEQDRLEKEAHLKLAQLYLGYLAREHTALIGESSR